MTVRYAGTHGSRSESHGHPVVRPGYSGPGRGSGSDHRESPDYGGFGSEVTETLPAGFAYSGSSPKSDQVEATGQTVRLTLQGDTSIAYTVTASDHGGPPRLLRHWCGTSDRNNHDCRRPYGRDGSARSEPTARPEPTATPELPTCHPVARRG